MKKLVYTRVINTAKGARYQVRWRERINGTWKELSKSFMDIAEAKHFANKVKLRLGAIQATGSVMDDIIKPPGKLELLIPEFINDAKLNGLSKDHMRNSYYYLWRFAKHFNWTNTADISKDNLKELKTHYGEQSYLKPQSLIQILSAKMNVI